VAEDIPEELRAPAPTGHPDPQESEGGVGRVILSGLFWLWVGVSGISLSLLGILLFLIFNPWVDPRRHVMAFVSSLWGKAIIYALPGIAFRVEGRSRLAALSGPFVFCPNHQSVADIPLLLTFLPLVKFFVRADVFSIPVMGLHLWLCGYIRVPKRGEPGTDPLLQAEFWLRRGCNIVIFPEGTRSPDIHRLLRFRRGAFELAQRVGVQLVPVAIQGTGRVLGKRKLRFRFTGRIRVQLLEPLWVTGDAREMAALVRLQIQHAIDQPA
jgi:1-acyl-sn-glycerol-3-phosphate acyltransferase